MSRMPFEIAVLVAGLWGRVFLAHAQAAPLVIETVTVGNPGNTGDPIQFQGVFGAVSYVFAIGKHEVAAGHYTAFLNAVAATDRYGLYDTRMWTHVQGCKIERTGSPGSYAYSVAPDWANRPVNFISWGDAARFANWLHNGQPAGTTDLSTTEDGSYFLNGKQTDWDLEGVVREPDATWVIPTENEWYKAAYYDGATGIYWGFPTGTNSGMSSFLVDPDPGNNATFRPFNGTHTIGPPYYRTEVGAHENSASAYGAFDMEGNVMEFNETVPGPDLRGIRGGSWIGDLVGKWGRIMDMHSSDEYSDLGFRVATLRSAVGVGPRSSTLSFSLRGANPVRGSATFVFDLQQASWVTLEVFDVTGRRVATLANGVMEPGAHETRWTAPGAPGVYFALLRAMGETRRISTIVMR